MPWIGSRIGRERKAARHGLLWAIPRVDLGPLQAEVLSPRRLNAETAPRAISEPQRYRAARESMRGVSGRVTVDLSAYEMVRIDLLNS